MFFFKKKKVDRERENIRDLLIANTAVGVASILNSLTASGSQSALAVLNNNRLVAYLTSDADKLMRSALRKED
jgi:hypothetical protein